MLYRPNYNNNDNDKDNDNKIHLFKPNLIQWTVNIACTVTNTAQIM